MTGTSTFPIMATWLLLGNASSGLATNFAQLADKHGIAVAFVIALGVFTVWKEKRLDRRDALDRSERKALFDELKDRCYENDKAIKEHTDWMRSQIEKNK